jgi:hypothetical protein
VKLVLGPPPSVYANRAFRRSCGGGPKREDHRLGLWWAVFYILGDSLLFVWRGAWLNSPFLKTIFLLRQILSSYTCASISERDRLLFFKSYVAGIFFGLDLSTLAQVLSQELYSPFSSEEHAQWLSVLTSLSEPCILHDGSGPRTTCRQSCTR